MRDVICICGHGIDYHYSLGCLHNEGEKDECSCGEFRDTRLATSEARGKELEIQASQHVGTEILLREEIEKQDSAIQELEQQLAAIRPAFEKLLEYAKAEEDSWEDFGNSDLDEYRQLRREALALAEKVEVKG